MDCASVMYLWSVSLLMFFLHSAAGDTTCTNNYGICRDNSEQCAGYYASGMCSGASNRQCCLCKDDKACINSHGTCQLTSEACPWGSYSSGKCGGPADRKCCIEDAACKTQYGECQYTSQSCSGGSYSSGLCAGPADRKCCIITKYTDAQARSRVTAAGMTVASSGSCNDRNNPTCTSLTQVRAQSIKEIVWLKRVSCCPIVITGGTETGHSGGTYSHWNGYKLDIRLDTCIDKYVKNEFPYIGKRSGDNAATYQDPRGTKYYLEGNHWDILYT